MQPLLALIWDTESVKAPAISKGCDLKDFCVVQQMDSRWSGGEGRNFSSWAQKCIFSTRFWKIGRLRASNHRDNAGFRWKADLFFHYGFCGGFCLFSQIAGVNLLMALKLPGQVYDEGNFFPKEEPWDATFGLDPKRWSVSGWKASQILPVIYVARDLEFINVYNLFEPSIQRSIQ